MLHPSVSFEIGYPGESWEKGVPSAINTLIERGMVDEKKLGVFGTSYGGYATNLLITQTNRFAAAVNISGKVDIISFLGDSPKIGTRNYNAAEKGQDRIGATLWEAPLKYIQHSAVMFADRIHTPLLMLTGKQDWNVPDTNEREMYYALRRLGREAVWVQYADAGHGAGRDGNEAEFRDHWSRMFQLVRRALREGGGEERRVGRESVARRRVTRTRIPARCTSRLTRTGRPAFLFFGGRLPRPPEFSCRESPVWPRRRSAG